MSSEELHVLLIEDNPGDARLIEEMLGDGEALLDRVGGTEQTERVRIVHETRLDDGLSRLADAPIDVVLLDLGLPDSDGVASLEAVTDAASFVPVVVLTGLRDEQVGLEAIQRGAQDYLVKDEVTSDLLVRSVHHAMERSRQAREQARRRDQLEALNRLTRWLTDAETPSELSATVVDAAPESLGLPVLGIGLYDDQTASLDLEGATDAAATIVSGTDMFAHDGGVGWQAFAESEVRRLVPTAESDRSATEVAVLPIGSHGVLVVGSTVPDGFSAADFDFAETVAGTLEASLDRVARERELHEREQTLASQNEQLARLKHVNDIIRAIDRALVEATTRQEVESVVCEQLASIGPYELAWIGEYDAIGDGITPREWAGNEAGFLDVVETESDGSHESRGPVGRAAATGDPQVVEEVTSATWSERWRHAALRRGYNSVISLPLSYEGTRYGVLTLAASESGVFDDLEREVLAELADNVAYAINALERKKALVSEAVTHLDFESTDPGLLAVRLTRELDCEFAVESLVPRTEGGVRSFFRTRGVAAAAVEEYATTSLARRVELVAEYQNDDQQVCLFEYTPGADSVEAALLAHGARPREFHAVDGVASVTVEVAGDADVREFVEMFQTRYPESELLAQRTMERTEESAVSLRGSLTEMLTDRQLEAFQTAYFSGYFETPRERTGTDVAKSMGISQPTFNKHLRAALRKIAERLLTSDPTAT